MALKNFAGLWKPEDPTKKYMASGRLEDGRRIYLFENDKGDNPRRPDYRIQVQEAEPEEENSGDSLVPF